MTGSDQNLHGSRTDRLLEHVNALGAERKRPPARERLERLLGDYLTRFLVGALSARRPRRADA